MTTSLTGTIHGKVIELDQEPGLPDGQLVTVTLHVARHKSSPTSTEALEALKRAAGGWHDDDPQGLEQFLQENRQQRKADRREIPE